MNLGAIDPGEVDGDAGDRARALDRPAVGLQAADPGARARRQELHLVADLEAPARQGSGHDRSGSVDREGSVDEQPGPAGRRRRHARQGVVEGDDELVDPLAGA
ncbi:MAG: hypothetical protein KatS3mg013_1436 [Actinomycetota bacterium]|nr:MAG: hypothetical protein KatS3mg013_1436 [Actinomycetota bacterium]